jgi:hypothetical protein
MSACSDPRRLPIIKRDFDNGAFGLWQARREAADAHRGTRLRTVQGSPRQM